MSNKFVKIWENIWSFGGLRKCKMVTMAKTTFELNKKTKSQNDGVLYGTRTAWTWVTWCKWFKTPTPSYKTMRWSLKSIKWPDAIKGRQPSLLFLNQLRIIKEPTSLMMISNGKWSLCIFQSNSPAALVCNSTSSVQS
jgi:hypothetical protein